MANLKLSRQVQVPNIDQEDFSPIYVVNVPSGTAIRQGSVWYIDVTQPMASPASLITSLTPTGPATFYPAFTPTAEVVVPAWSPNIGATPVCAGVYQGPTFTLTSAPLVTAIPLRQIGSGVVLAAAEGGTAVLVGSQLIASATQYGAKAGAWVVGTSVGVAGGYLINTALTAAATAGSGVVVPVNSITGITTSTALTFDTPASGVQETATPTALVSGVNANQTFTVGGTVTAAAVLTINIGGVASATYTTISGDTATTAATALVRAFNANVLVAGPGATFLPATNAAGVITVRYGVANSAAGAGSNLITTTVTTSNLGTTTFVAGGATLASGTQNTITVTLSNNHALGSPVQGIQNTVGANLIPGTANALSEYLINANILVR